MVMKLEYQDEIAVLTLGDSENRFTPEWLDSLDANLDEVEDNARGLITVGVGKFYSNGLNLEWLRCDGERKDSYVGRVHDLLNRILIFPLPSVAAINGHAFGAGAMFALAHDYRIMREDRGYLCLPEVDINVPFTPGMAALVQAKLSPQAAMTAMTTGHRYGGTAAFAAGLVDGAATVDELLETARGVLTPIVGKDRQTLQTIKSTMFASVTSALRPARS
ncbi:enoyl-CoA hydratase/isomerase family protein [Rhodococcus sp. 06-156-3C]|uniref:enoyl-CoA hydratase/isomerase family protein n=1 Tax=Nocardiaceae TaxID=85025 RepID=UPI00052305D8|nr:MULTISPECIES: enoyl-CoA hydratase/isomerase family protein [Rhodococcus]OZD18243.1 enoyl-CoA hydratase/isomerase family protein [Rhodococcus sp. 06-156-4C]OZD18841.1 enoyl-CoA hydratase/isomerase family protein [Rhodococcus sp. 06-156-3C]OZD22351.1 enoyl-CoA hydratase/isomerase family protein [Rhodococcus sp. 06-156-4a]OZD33935.1 enoyl-CoA hydratase/isomerase family protein [Rhodococcus sp. 06-156-3b]OZD38672.1 enoyl-CoA hydratase/isomerase family protein [Rhodococcus sp. 06-156-3]